MVDNFGIRKLHPSLPGCREFYLPPLDINPVSAVIRIGNTEMVVRGNGSVNPHTWWYVMNGSPRLYVYKPFYPAVYDWEDYFWHNVEMTCYYKRPDFDSIR
jgi:hypothetical protein